MRPSALYKALSREFGSQNWWPVTDAGAFAPTYKKRAGLTEKQKFEIMAGAILAQNTAWINVMRALENLSRAGLLDCAKIAKTKKQKIARLVKPSGYFNMKAEKLKRFAAWLQKNHGGKPSRFFGSGRGKGAQAGSGKSIGQLRSELLSLYGIGNETADSMLLYAGNLPSFVIDAYTLRFMERFYAMRGINYVEAKSFFERSLPHDAALFSEFHALLVELGKNHCKKSRPRCAECCVRLKCKFAGH